MMKAFLLFVVCIIFCSSSLFSQWGPDVRLTSDSAASRTSYNNAWCVASSGDTIHVVWYDDRDGIDQIYYKRSTDGGTTWGPDTRLTNTTRNARNPSVAFSGSTVHVVWEDFRLLNLEIFYKRSPDGGASWSTDTQLSDNPLSSDYPTLCASGSNVYVVWHDNRDGNDFEVFYTRSANGGISWVPESRLSDTPDNSWFPSIAVSDSTVHLVWWDNRNGNDNIFYKRSTNNGVSWSADSQLTDDPDVSWYPSIAASGSTVHTVWWDGRDGNWEIYYKRSTDGGTTWDPDTRLTDFAGNSSDPSVAASGNDVHVVWWENRDANNEIYYKSSANAGANWGTDTRLTNASGNSWYPSVSVSDNCVNVVWEDDRDGNWEIYYKRNMLGISEHKANLLTGDCHLSVFPTVSGGPVAIKFTVTERQHMVVVLYDVSGKIVKTVLDRACAPGNYLLTWDGTDEGLRQVASGVYFCRLIHATGMESQKILLLKQQDARIER